MGISGAALLVTSVGTYKSVMAGREAAHFSRQQVAEQKAAAQAQERMAQVEAQRARIAQVREARIRRAQIIASSTEQGAGSSGVAGATAGITSQTAGNIGTIGQTQTFAAQASAASQRAADASGSMVEAQTKGQQWQTISTIFGASRSDFTSIFGGNTIPNANANIDNLKFNIYK